MIDAEKFRRVNTLLEYSGLEWISFRLSHLRAEAHFHFKLVDPPFSVSHHCHEHWEVCQVLGGQPVYFADAEGREMEILPSVSRFLVIPPRTIHRWVAGEGKNHLAGWQIKLWPEEEEGKRILAAMADHFRKSGFLFDADELQLKACDCLLPIADGRYPAELVGPMANGVARILVGSLVGATVELHRSDMSFGEGTADPSKNLANRIKEFIEANLCRAVFLDDIASHFHYSARHLNRVFDRFFHKSIGHYMRERRLELAERWLVTTDRSVKDIGLSLGYDNISYFSRYFKLRTGYSPSDYRIVAREKPQPNTFSNPKTR